MTLSETRWRDSTLNAPSTTPYALIVHIAHIDRIRSADARVRTREIPRSTRETNLGFRGTFAAANADCGLRIPATARRYFADPAEYFNPLQYFNPSEYLLLGAERDEIGLREENFGVIANFPQN